MRLGAPLRVAWDWRRPPVARSGAGPDRPPAELVRAVGAEIVRSRVLMLEVGYPDANAVAGGELAAALDGFAGALSLVVGPEAADALGAPPWAGFEGAEVWLDATPPTEGEAPGVPRAWPAVRWYLTATNVGPVVRSVVRALNTGTGAVSLPNLPLFGAVLAAGRKLVPQPAHLRAFAEGIAPALRAHPGVDLRVHHYGLSEELRARGLAPQGEDAPGAAGCQAGAALAYVDPAGVLYPCASLPIPLERMGEGSLARAWAGGELAALRTALARLPAACGGCPHEASCRGGCRGWAHFLSGDWSATGPDCVK